MLSVLIGELLPTFSTDRKTVETTLRKTMATGMASSIHDSRHIASGLLGIDTNLEQQLDAVQATYFSQASSTEDFSSESESEVKIVTTSLKVRWHQG